MLALVSWRKAGVVLTEALHCEVGWLNEPVGEEKSK